MYNLHAFRSCLKPVRFLGAASELIPVFLTNTSLTAHSHDPEVCGGPSIALASRTLATESRFPRKFGEKQDLFSKTGVPGIKNVVAVASGKGGVGKSTVAANLAVALAQFPGVKVGLADADVYGPSIPTLMNLAQSGEPSVDKAGLMVPKENYGVKCMSMGFLLKAGAAAVWRGPMAMKALNQIIFQTAWGPLDVLVVDMPPGTGDVQITVAQRCRLAGAVVVSTPQEIALVDARRGITMFSQVGVPVLGLVENMAFFRCGGCSEQHFIFGRDGVSGIAAESSVDVLGRVPLEEATRRDSDEGTPVVVRSPGSESAGVFRGIASGVLAKLGLSQERR
mmetsp:Transcript_33324/g.79027  ORF Transcript_33324/g.79027 Transcript_33324/m.79027 type:complete len:337 (+) Transcript_33324:47-1057(+)